MSISVESSEIGTRKFPKPVLVEEFSDQQYPFSYFVEISYDHIDGFYRGGTKQLIQHELKRIDAQDYKIIDGYYGFDVMFKHDFDFQHFKKIWDRIKTNGNPLEKIEQTFDELTLPGKQIRKCFKRAAKKAGLAEEITVTTSPHQTTVYVEAKNTDTYFEMWRKIPYNRRLYMFT